VSRIFGLTIAAQPRRRDVRLFAARAAVGCSRLLATRGGRVVVIVAKIPWAAAVGCSRC
jgi:hypothetical protein